MKFLYQPKVDEKTWNEFIVANGGSFLQSYDWGEFQKRFGHQVVRATVVDDAGMMLCAATVVGCALPLGKRYWYLPFGPVVANAAVAQTVVSFLLEQLRRMVPPGAIFVKAEPDANARFSCAECGFRPSPKTIQAQETIIADLSFPEEELLARMKQKTRYNMRLAARHGVKIITMEHKDRLDPETFLSLLAATAVRNKFRTHPVSYYRAMMDMFVGRPVASGNAPLSMRLFFAQLQGEVVAAALVGFFGRRATYLHGGSSDRHKNVMAPYLLHWEIMRFAKQKGFWEYDFWGTVTDRTPPRDRARWEGFARFKEGFGGAVVEYPGSWDLPVNKLWYNAYTIGRKIL
ncbi:MAG: peptidoglycan bridge formation glycyltransferase FemA/FemB family protein [Patescibacteria group bacterium]